MKYAEWFSPSHFYELCNVVKRSVNRSSIFAIWGQYLMLLKEALINIHQTVGVARRYCQEIIAFPSFIGSWRCHIIETLSNNSN